MKKLLLSVAFLSATFIGANAQTFSFESSEGYTLGDLNGQNGWTINPTLPDNPNNPTFTVTSSMATDGSNSFYAQGTNLPYQYQDGSPVLMGAFSEELNIAASAFQISADMYMTDILTGQYASDVYFGADSAAEQYAVSRIVFSYDGNIYLADTIDGVTDYYEVGTFDVNTWYNIRMDYDFNAQTITYYLNDELLHSGSMFSSATTVDTVFFIFDNYGSGFYVDNVVINTGTASTEDFASNFSVYPNPATNVINVSNSADVINNVTITDLNGRTVKQVTVGVNDAQINISDLAQGVYILNATSNGKSFTQKIVKQ